MTKHGKSKPITTKVSAQRVDISALVLEELRSRGPLSCREWAQIREACRQPWYIHLLAQMGATFYSFCPNFRRRPYFIAAGATCLALTVVAPIIAQLLAPNSTQRSIVAIRTASVAPSRTRGGLEQNPSARPINLSKRGQVLIGTNLLLPDIVIAPGRGNLRLLIRAVGPALANPPFNEPGSLADPLVIVTNAEGTEVARNDNWQTAVGYEASSGQELVAATASVGAFPFPPGSRDAALIFSASPGSYHVQVTGVDGGTGFVIAEVYELP